MWITIKAEQVLYVDYGRDVILCDRGHRGPVTIVVRLKDGDALAVGGANGQHAPQEAKE